MEEDEEGGSSAGGEMGEIRQGEGGMEEFLEFLSQNTQRGNWFQESCHGNFIFFPKRFIPDSIFCRIF